MKGETLGHYQIQRRIGAGGMGMVYAATDTRLERPVAIKVIHEGLENDDLRERFWREAKAAAAVQHPGVCQVHEVGEDAGRLFIVMELLQGQTLEDRLAYGPIELDEALRIVLALLDTLAGCDPIDIRTIKRFQLTGPQLHPDIMSDLAGYTLATVRARGNA